VTAADAIRDAAAVLAATSDTARLDAEVLMAHALGVSRSDMLLRHMRDTVPAGFAALVERRQAHEPVAYIIGEQEFFGLPLRVSPAVLIPRGDSEVLVEAALAAHPAAEPDAKRVLDCGTGSGALLLAVLHGLPQASGTGIDRSADALAVAHINVDRHQLQDRVRLVESDGWSALHGPYDLILCNPPYVCRAGMDALPPEYLAEPRISLDGGLEGGDDGMDFVRHLLNHALEHMTEHAVLVLEIGNEREHFERAFPTLLAYWPQTTSGEGPVLLITREALEDWQLLVTRDALELPQ